MSFSRRIIWYQSSKPEGNDRCDYIIGVVSVNINIIVESSATPPRRTVMTTQATKPLTVDNVGKAQGSLNMTSYY